MSSSFHFEELEHFTAGTVGPKGQRTFFLQFGTRGNLVSLKLEKGQVHALAEFLDQLLEDVPAFGDEEVPLALEPQGHHDQEGAGEQGEDQGGQHGRRVRGAPVGGWGRARARGPFYR